ALLFLSDHDFARALEKASDEIGEGVAFVVWSVLTSGGYLFTHALHLPETRATSSAVTPGPYRGVSEDTIVAPAWQARPPVIGPVTWATVVGQVALVFALFVGANLRHLFGGDALVRGSDGVTYASYLHTGFAQLLFATILSVCLVLGGHALLRPRGDRRGA